MDDDEPDIGPNNQSLFLNISTVILHFFNLHFHYLKKGCKENIFTSGIFLSLVDIG